MDQIVSVGRRKRAVARIFFKSGGGSFSINKKELETYFPLALTRQKMLEPFAVLDINHADYAVNVNVAGGGITGQAEAIRLGLARALVESNEEFRGPLKKAGFLTRDARKVERKKYGKKKARKSSQFSKR